jgi:hypothetical protein
MSVLIVARAYLRDALGGTRTPETVQHHLDAAIRWLCRAQDATGTGGVARSYALRWQRMHGRRGWLPAYPETTGYIIPTFFDYARLTGDEEYRDRALQMARWEISVQMECGAVQGGVIGVPQTPAVFNTGQVLFGWARAFRETGDERFRDALVRAGDFLVDAQDADGAWRRHGSQYARPGLNVYDARTAWGLAEAAAVTDNRRYRDAAGRNIEFVQTEQRANGWFANCCLDDNTRPLLHTLAYTMEGCLETGALLNRPEFTHMAQRAADALLAAQQPDGGLAGCFDDAWRPAATWSCLTGDAQTALVWFRLFELTGERRYFDAARRLNRFVMATQDLTATDPGVRGGIKGSQPIWGAYGTDEYLNWAAKFFADALMREHQLTLPPRSSR